MATNTLEAAILSTIEANTRPAAALPRTPPPGSGPFTSPPGPGPFTPPPGPNAITPPRRPRTRIVSDLLDGRRSRSRSPLPPDDIDSIDSGLGLDPFGDAEVRSMEMDRYLGLLLLYVEVSGLLFL